MKRSAVVLVALGGCADDGAAISIGYGTLSEDHEAARSFGCAADLQVHRVVRGDTTLSAQTPGVSRRLAAEEGVARFDFTVEPTHSNDTALITLTSVARVEGTYCGTGCPGSSGRASFSWRGWVALPSPGGYHVRITMDAFRHTDIAPNRFAGECQIETPWRAPIVVESGVQSREFDVPSGDATIALSCQRAVGLAFASVACYGAPHEGPPSLSNTPATVDARLQVRIALTPRP